MRSSPINHIRNNRDYTSSPYESKRKGSPLRDSPERGHLGFLPTQNADYWKVRSRQLEAELLAVNEELLFQARKNEKVDDLEEKIELLLAQNTHFVDENENLIRLVQQKNSDIELWKKKFDNEYSHSNLAEMERRKVFDHLNLKDQEHQIQIEKLLSEITRLQNQAVQAHNGHQLEVHLLKNRYESQAMNQIQNLKRSQHGNHEIQELNIRKLKDTIEERNFEIENLRRETKFKEEAQAAAISFNDGESKRLEQQHTHELKLLVEKHENDKRNLLHNNRKNQEEMKNLNEAKTKRLMYEIEERKNEIEEFNVRLKRIGKENQSQMTRMLTDNGSLRTQLQQNGVRHRQRIEELTEHYERQLNQERDLSKSKNSNLSDFFTREINSLQEVIAAKEAEIKRLLELNAALRANEENRLRLINENNTELKSKLEETIMHYEREVELMKIKITQLYEADIEALRSNLLSVQSQHAREVQNLRNLLTETQLKLAEEVQIKLDLRKDYELRLTEIRVLAERDSHQTSNIIAQHQKQIQNNTSNASLTHIEHNNLLQDRSQNMKEMMNTKRTLESHIQGKNKEIEALNLRIEKMLGLHKRDIGKLEEDLEAQKNAHESWLERQKKQTQESHAEKNQLALKVEALNKQIQEIKKNAQTKEQDLKVQLDKKTLEIAALKGKIQEMENKIGSLQSKQLIERGNMERSQLETKVLMDSEKEKLFETVKKEKSLTEQGHQRIRQGLEGQIQDLKHENEILEDNYRKAQIREQELKIEIKNLAETVNERNRLEEHVINIGLSNNYFKNVAEVFKRTIEP